jgi:peptidoglycan/xylan/chitin deacetylase (PgdA/CDA1 family)
MIGPQEPATSGAGSPRLTKGAAAESLVGSPMMRWLLRLPLWRGVLVLAYHRIQREDEETPFDPGVVSATPAILDRQLALMARVFDVVRPDEVERDPDALGRRVLITFDDGYRDNYELAFPLLRKHGVPGTFFLTTGFLDSPRVPWWDELAWMVKRSPRRMLDGREWFAPSIPLDGDRRAAIERLAALYKSLPTERAEAFLDFCGRAAGTGRCNPSAGADLWMTWSMAAELRDAGMTIGGHTASHPVLARTSPEQQASEIGECRRRLREELGIPMRFFAYPVGLPDAFDQATKHILRAEDVALAFSLYGGYVGPRKLDPYDLPRASVSLARGQRGFQASLALPQVFARW